METQELEQPVPQEVETPVEEVKVEEQVDEAKPVEQPAEDDVVVSIGDEPAPEEPEAKAPEWVRELRKQHREAQRKIKEYEARLAQTESKSSVTQLDAKPKLEDFDYNTEDYENALVSWFEKKRQYDEAQQRIKQAEEEQTLAWQKKLEGYAAAKQSLKVRDYEDAELVVQDSLTTVQQGIILQGAENPALVVYALGKNQSKAKELAAITDPVKFAFAVSKLESQLKITPRKAPPAPDTPVTGTAPISGAVDSVLERLRAEAYRTGDYTKVTAYKQQQKQKRA